MIFLGISFPFVVSCAAVEPAAPAAPAGGGPAATQQAAQPRPPRRAPAAPAVWRVAQDGTTGCADPDALRLLREPASDAAALRRLATARTAGGCVTVFRGQGWRLLERTGEMLRLAPAEEGAGPGPLYFWRDQVVEERAG
ncbi:hypothetical protein [Falsiroseomonas sp.]|uniref:hypothetical protein n=1 Tax=Falsiroseomonas sp. TaxID=2870721 RepID=UPI00356B5A9B